ncbi:arylesterase [Guyparkeria sp.]|uniref:arylesterase n=1 Tax=Guyparkeria sp. TaxID=2035736 RepID=UPI003970472C
MAIGPLGVRSRQSALRPFALLVALLVTGCGGGSLEPLAPGDVILAFGDSLTEGVGASADTSYPARLAALSGHTVVNAGVSGETTAEGLERLPAVLDETDPGLMILLLGGNDILRNGSPTEAKRNLSRMIEMALERGVQVLLVGVPEKSLFSRSAPFYQELAEQHGVVLMDGMVASLLKKPAYKSDQVHLNTAGYREMAGRIHARLAEEGALR